MNKKEYLQSIYDESYQDELNKLAKDNEAAERGLYNRRGALIGGFTGAGIGTVAGASVLPTSRKIINKIKNSAASELEKELGVAIPKVTNAVKGKSKSGLILGSAALGLLGGGAGFMFGASQGKLLAEMARTPSEKKLHKMLKNKG